LANLVTHADCVGMTGTGKTGLVGRIQEIAIDRVPAILIGPWVNEEDAAAKKGVSPKAYEGEQAAPCKSRLADWGQDGERTQRLRDSADFAFYTPGQTSASASTSRSPSAAPLASFRPHVEVQLPPWVIRAVHALRRQWAIFRDEIHPE